MLRRLVVAAVAPLALVSSSTAVLPAAATTNQAVGAHKLIVAVRKTLGPAAEKKLAVLVVISQNGGAPAGALATASKPLTVFQTNRGLYRVQAQIDASCKGSCTATYRISGAANHKLEVIPSCRLKGPGLRLQHAEDRQGLLARPVVPPSARRLNIGSRNGELVRRLG